MIAKSFGDPKKFEIKRPDDLEVTESNEALENAPCSRQLEYYPWVTSVVTSEWELGRQH